MPKTVKYLIVCIAGFCLLTNCKKNKSSSNPPASTTTSSVSSFSFNGICTVQMYYLVSGASTTTMTGQQLAYFSTNLFDNFFLNPTAQNVGNVRLNGIQFRNTFSYNYYNDSTGVSFYPPFTWEISGGAIPGFTFTNNNPYPNFTGYSSWPDTISISSGFTISLAGNTNVDQAQIVFSDNDTTSVFNSFGSPVTSFSYSPSALTAIATNTTAQIQLSLYKNSIQSISGKTINFRTNTEYHKTVWVKN